jgi:hypothetical protein
MRRPRRTGGSGSKVPVTPADPEQNREAPGLRDEPIAAGSSPVRLLRSAIAAAGHPSGATTVAHSED